MDWPCLFEFEWVNTISHSCEYVEKFHQNPISHILRLLVHLGPKCMWGINSKSVTHPRTEIRSNLLDVWPESNISYLNMCIPKILYLTVVDFMRYNISDITPVLLSHGCRFHEIHQNLLVANFMKNYTRNTISHDILRQNLTISWLQISWDISP